LVALVLVAVAGTAIAFTWQRCLRALVYEVPLRYDEPFGPAVAGADRLVVHGDGFDCCGPIDETNILFEVTDPQEVESVRSHVAFVARTTSESFMETCMCCGGPGLHWYRGGKRIALTAMQHGHAIRWKGFFTSRILGFRMGYGDGPLTEESQQWLSNWFAAHGVATEQTKGLP
jgi:hypothetical protein